MSAILTEKTVPANTAASAPDLEPAIANALSRIPPLWPLQHFVAVNPFASLSPMPFAQACALLERTTGAAPLQSPADYLAAWKSGAITKADLEAAATPPWTPDILVQALIDAPGADAPQMITTVADLLDAERPHAHWSVFVTEEISKWCAVTFDVNQTTWRSPWKEIGLFAAWRAAACHDLNPETFGLAGFRAFIADLPEDSAESIAHCMAILSPQSIGAADFLHRQLASISGWAGHVKYLVREDEMRGRENPALRDLLAIRLAYDAALYQAFARDGVFRANWRHQHARSHGPRMLEALVIWQSAYEAGYQRGLANTLAAQPSALPETRPAFQAVFCIDVRSEVFRRHLEAAAPAAQTIGFAGFFGFPVAHKPAAVDTAASRCPVLLVPPVESCEPLPATQSEAAHSKRAAAGAWKAFQNSAASCFSFVESAGLAFAAKLGGSRHPHSSCGHAHHKPAFADEHAVPVGTRATLATGALKNMGLTRNFARLILICGHGSQSANNPYASGLDCGACGGHAGDVNARLAAATLNDPAVRAILADQGIRIPADTRFIAGLHNTSTDEVTLFEDDPVPPDHTADLAALRGALASAGHAARIERAPTLGMADVPAEKLLPALHARAADISQVRPEWGLANNAALIAAPRSRTASLDLDGRVFLHDYDAASDPQNEVLTLILCAPVVVASWINLQYYASRIAPVHFAAGNKTIHQVVAGIGVIEGNAGDLRTGLPLQSIHDGKDFVHEPRRLTVFIESEPERIDAVLDAHPAVKQLFDHQWIHLVCLTGDAACQRHAGKWRPLACQNSGMN